MRLRIVAFSSFANAAERGCAALGVVVGGGVARVLLERPPPRRPSSRPGARACPRPASRRRASAPCEARICSISASSICGGSTWSFSLPALAASSRCACAELLDRVVGDVERVEDLRLGDLVGAGLDHQDGLFGAGDDQVEVAAALGAVDQRLLGRVDDEVAVDLADADRADGRRQRDRRETSAPRRRRSSRGCRTGGRGRRSAASRPAASRSASPWGRAGGSGGRSCAR